MQTHHTPKGRGLTTEEAKRRLEEIGSNELTPEEKPSFFRKLLSSLKEPMFLLLMIAAMLYFLLGEPGDGLIMLVFVVFVLGIEVFQEWKTDRSLSALRDLSSPRITVLRDGKIVLDDACTNIEMNQVIQYIVGSDMNKKFEWIPRTYPIDQPPVLEVANLKYKNRVKDISFALHPSEILGIAGLMGSGRSETLLSIFGLLKPDAGEILVDGKPCVIRTPSDAIAKGIALVPESRRVQGLVVEHSVKENVIITILDRIKKGILLSEKEANRRVKDQISLLNIKTDGIHKKVRLLSGGNQQKVVISKWLANQSRILMLDEPTVGVDIGAKTEIIHIIRQLADEGHSILIVSSELNELLAIADRILIFKDGLVINEMMRKEITSEEVLQHAIQGYQ